MKNLKTLERLQQLHNLIAVEKTGTPKELAALMQISERSIHLLIEQLKESINFLEKRVLFYM